MTKREFGGLAWLELALLMAPSCSQQEEITTRGIATVNELKAALTDTPKGGVIEVTHSLDLTASPLSIQKDVTLRLPEGVTLTTRRSDEEGTQTAGIYVAPEATLTLNGPGSLQGDSRIVDIDGTLQVDGVSFRTTSKTRGSAITVNPGGRLNFEEGAVDASFTALWIEGEATLSGGTFVSTSSSQDPELRDAPSWTYAIRIEGTSPDVTIQDGVYVEGVQGCLAMEPYGGTCVINGGTFVTRPRCTEGDNFSALSLIGGECTVNGGRFYSQNHHCLWVAVDDEYKELYLRGGEFSDKGYYAVQLPDGTSYSQDDVMPDEGYAWVETANSVDGLEYKYMIEPVDSAAESSDYK